MQIFSVTDPPPPPPAQKKTNKNKKLNVVWALPLSLSQDLRWNPNCEAGNNVLKRAHIIERTLMMSSLMIITVE